MMSLQPEFLEGFQGKKEPARLARKGTKAIALIEGLCAFVLGIDDDGVHGDRSTRPDDSADRIKEQRLPKSVPLQFTIDSETTEHGSRFARAGGNSSFSKLAALRL
jgi:hypothetical protein